MNILITGSNGFIGKNLINYFKSYTNHNIYEFSKNDDLNDLENLISNIDVVFHFAGINKAEEKILFEKVNVSFTKKICKIIKKNPNLSLFYASSIQIKLNNNYGKSKMRGEQVCLDLKNKFKNKVYILRLPGIFGIGCKPNYNSVVATFCHNTANKIPLNIINPDKEIELLFVEDLCEQLNILINKKYPKEFIKLQNVHKISIKRLAAIIKNFHKNYNKIDFIESNDVLERNLHKTYISYMSNY